MTHPDSWHYAAARCPGRRCRSWSRERPGTGKQPAAPNGCGPCNWSRPRTSCLAFGLGFPWSQDRATRKAKLPRRLVAAGGGAARAADQQSRPAAGVLDRPVRRESGRLRAGLGWRASLTSCDGGSDCASGVSCGRPCGGLYLGDDWPCVLLRLSNRLRARRSREVMNSLVRKP